MAQVVVVVLLLLILSDVIVSLWRTFDLTWDLDNN